MLHETIFSHADLLALQARLQALQARSGEAMLVNLVSLESVRIARESYAFFRPLMGPRSWLCPQMDVLSIVSGLALELHKVEHDLLPPPPLLLPEAKLERGVLEAVQLMKNSAFALLHLGTSFNEALQELGGSRVENLVSTQVEAVGVVLKKTAVQVLEGNPNFVWLREERVPLLLDLIHALLATPVYFRSVFPESESESESDSDSDE